MALSSSSRLSVAPPIAPQAPADAITSNAERVLSYLRRHHARALTLVTEGTPADDVSAQDAGDIIYALVLIGRSDMLTADGAAAFAAQLKRWRLAGRLNAPGERSQPASVHLTAYALGAAVLLRSAGHDISREILAGERWRLNDLFDGDLRPRWPAQWSHHSWRVSHWVGGAPSILLSLARLAPARCHAQDCPNLADVLAASDALVDGETGLLKTYRSRFLQSLFRAAYRLRHDPDAGDVGGVVHLHWVNYAADRMPYKAAGALFERAVALLGRTPFIERTPYCLDFDVIQIVRTASPSPAALSALRSRARQLAEDISGFFETGLTHEYGLHRLPGALAAQHECALITGDRTVHGQETPPIDIIPAAGWI